jgi:hypothetical protein
MTFKEYKDFENVAGQQEYRNNVTYYDPTKGWIIDLKRKINTTGLQSN